MTKANPLKDKYIDHIIQLMVERKWHPGHCTEKLAKEWGVSSSTVSDWAHVASGVLKRANGPLVEWVNEKLQELDSIASAAMQKKRHLVTREGVVEVPEPDFNTAVKAISVAADIRGAKLMNRMPPEKPKGDEKDMTEEQLWQKLDELRAERLKGAH